MLYKKEDSEITKLCFNAEETFENIVEVEDIGWKSIKIGLVRFEFACDKHACDKIMP